MVSDNYDEALDVMQELEQSNDDIDEVLQKVALKRRPKRSCKPSAKAIERAQCPSTSTDASDVNDFENV